MDPRKHRRRRDTGRRPSERRACREPTRPAPRAQLAFFAREPLVESAIAVIRITFVLAAFVAGCVSASPGAAEYRGDSLDMELSRLGADASPRTTIARSRILRALGRQAEASAQLEASLDGARRALDWRGMSALWRELGDLQIEIGRPQEALDTFAKRLTNAKSLDVKRDRALAQVDMAYAFVFLSQWT